MSGLPQTVRPHAKPLSETRPLTRRHSQKPWLTRWLTVGLALLTAIVGWLGSGERAIAKPLLKPLLAPINGDNEEVYKYRSVHDPDGIGKTYMGREIAHYMGHRGAAWLERPDREVQEQPKLLIDVLNLEPTDVVADIGAGTGYMSFRMATEVPEGKVLAVDIQPEMLEMLEFFQEINQIENVETVLGNPDNPNLPDNTVDLALMVDAYHEFEYPYEMMQGIVRSLKSNGRAVLVEYRGENWLLPIKRLHKMTEAQVKREMENVGLEWQETLEILPQQHILIFSKPALASSDSSVDSSAEEPGKNQQNEI